LRHPLRKAGYGLFFVVLGAAGALAAHLAKSWLGDDASFAILFPCLLMAGLALLFLAMALLAARGHARLSAGIGRIAGWHVTAAEWDRFRAFDALRAKQHISLIGDFAIRKHTPESGVNVIVGRRQIIVDGSYHTLSRFGLPALTAVYWLPAPADPECLEFALLYPGGRYGGARRVSLRVPVPAAARNEGVRVYRHFHALVPPPRPALAFRRPRLVIGGGLGVTLAAAAAAGAGWVIARQSAPGTVAEIAEGGMVVAIGVAIAALLVTAIVAIVVASRKK